MGVKGQSRLAGARSAALEAHPPTQHHGSAGCATGVSMASSAIAAVTARDGRLLLGMPGASRLFGGHYRDG